jgi:hypothetical protein
MSYLPLGAVTRAVDASFDGAIIEMHWVRMCVARTGWRKGGTYGNWLAVDARPMRGSTASGLAGTDAYVMLVVVLSVIVD